MTRPVKRRYTSTVRREQAAATRVRILDAAAALFTTEGYGRTTVKQIADAAGVASETIYATFGSKARVLTALIDLRLTGDQDLSNVLEVPEAIAIRDEKDQRKQIRLYTRFMTTVMRRVGPVYAIMRSAAAADPEMATIYDEMQSYRARNAKVIAGWIAKNGKLSMKADRAGEVIWALGSPELASMLTEQQGWSETDYYKWLEETLTLSLLRG
jgi:AcrR family transcriptional regulator